MTWIPVDFSDQKEVYAHFYIQVGTLKDPISKPIENQWNIVTSLVTRIKEWKYHEVNERYCTYVLSFTDIFMLIVLSVPHNKSFLLPLPSYLFRELDKNQNREWL